VTPDDDDGFFGEPVAARYDETMAELAGMEPRERWAGWTREPFTSESTSHVSVWDKPA
jgi:hypothetical protein